MEYLEECFPWLRDALARDGFVVGARLALMTCAQDALVWPDADADIRPVEPGSELVGPMLAARTQPSTSHRPRPRPSPRGACMEWPRYDRLGFRRVATMVHLVADRGA